MPLPIETNRLLLSAPAPEDAEGLLRVYARPEVVQYLSGEPAKSLDEIHTKIALRASFQHSRGFTFWTMRLKKTGEIIGAAGLIPLERKGPEIELGYHLTPDQWGRGYATEAAIASLDYGFNEAGLRQIVAVYDPANEKSAAVLKRAGMTNHHKSRAYDRDVMKCEARRNTWRLPTGQV